VQPVDEPTPPRILRELLVRHPDAASLLAEASHRGSLATHSAAAAGQVCAGMHEARSFFDELRHRLDPRHQRPVGYATGLVLLAGIAIGLAALNGIELSAVFPGWMGVPAIVAATAVWLTGAWLAAVIRRERRRRLVLAVAASVAMFSLVLAALHYFIVPPFHAGRLGGWDRAAVGAVCAVLIDVLAVGAAVLIQRMEPGPVFLARQRWRRARADHQAATKLAEADAEAAAVAQQAWLGMVRTQAIAAAGATDIRLVESTLALAAALQRKPHPPG
jgi:hypothetical protein